MAPPRIDIQFDSEASVYIATSPDIPGLVVEAPTLVALQGEIPDCITMLREANSA